MTELINKTYSVLNNKETRQKINILRTCGTMTKEITLSHQSPRGAEKRVELNNIQRSSVLTCLRFSKGINKQI